MQLSLQVSKEGHPHPCILPYLILLAVTCTAAERKGRQVAGGGGDGNYTSGAHVLDAPQLRTPPP
jgi:hypothetical protein